MKKILIILVTFSVFWGYTTVGAVSNIEREEEVCSAYGTFSNLEKGKSTLEEVRSVLGEPAEQISYEDGQEVWKYHFVKIDIRDVEGSQINLLLEITFKNEKLDTFKLTSLMEPSQEKSEKGGKKKSGEEFIQELDRNNDGQVSKEEFIGPSQVFDYLDRNQDGYIDDDEAPPPPSDRP